MKGLFPHFDPCSTRDFQKIWGEALFVFDTNVLLNLYRYQPSTRDQLLEVLEKLSDRIWIPHHVALEFQRNRLNVIADQNNRFSEVRQAVRSSTGSLRSELEKLQLVQRHSLIDPAPLTSGFNTLAEKFLSELDEIQKNQQNLTSPDPLKEKIENLFDGRVGEEPDSQKSLEEAYKTAEKRYALKIPPGYMDREKDKQEPDEHLHNGLLYKRKYGDYLVWRQLLEHAKKTDAKSVIFVTDDGKDDWWWSIKSGGSKTVGPRPELRDEAATVGALSDFLMYKPGPFLEYANKFLATEVSEATLEEVRDVSDVRSRRNELYHRFRQASLVAEEAVYQWLKRKFSSVHRNERGFPDFVAMKSGKRFGFEVKTIPTSKTALMRIRDVAYRAHFDVAERNLDMVTIVLVAPTFSEADDTFNALLRRPIRGMPKTVRILIGTVDEGEEEGEFIPYRDVSLSEAEDVVHGD